LNDQQNDQRSDRQDSPATLVAMADPISFDAPAGEPLSILESAIEGVETLVRTTGRHLEFSCRGDRVPLDLLTPDSGGPHPTLIVQPAPGQDGPLPSLRGLHTWLGAGAAVCSVGLPLFGARRSPKISEQLEASIARAAAGEAPDRTSSILWTEFTRQAVMELRRGLDAVAEVTGTPHTAVAFSGAGIAASLGALLCAVDDRIGGAVLASTGGGFGPPEIDPASWIGDVSPRPLLFINQQQRAGSPGAPAIPKASAEALHMAAGDPKEIEWSEEEPDLLNAAWKFLPQVLGL
jgi:hypothetical protein